MSSDTNATAPITTMPRKTMSVARNRSAFSTITPMPAFAATISTATRVVPAEGDRHPHAGEDLGKRGLVHHLPEHLVGGRPHGVEGLDLLDRDRSAPWRAH